VYFPYRTFVSNVSEILILFPFPELPFFILFPIKKYENGNSFSVYRLFSSLPVWEAPVPHAVERVVPATPVLPPADREDPVIPWQDMARVDTRGSVFNPSPYSPVSTPTLSPECMSGFLLPQGAWTPRKKTVRASA
jgi:hypothetical protein